MNSSLPLKALRRFCLDCQGGYRPSVQDCRDEGCIFHALRLFTAEDLPEEIRPQREIRRFCLECAGGRAEVRGCDAKESCPLWSFRFGVLPGTFKRVVRRVRKERETILLPGIRLSEE